MKAPLLEALQTRVLLGDGAMGTQLQLAGMEAGYAGEAWNADHPDRVAAIQQRYADAGSDCLITNTFGANKFRLSLHSLEDRARQFNVEGSRVARKVMGEDRYVLGDIGPFGGFLEPLGEYSREDVTAEFERQAAALAEGGADAFIIETMTALDEIEAAVEACRNAAPRLPVIASLAFDKVQGGGYRTMMGVSPEQAAEALDKMGVDIIAANCGTGIGITDYHNIVSAYRSKTTKPIMAQPNAGMPELRDDQIVYHETPEKMAEQVAKLVECGAQIIGGCCGTTPEHIALFRKELDKLASAK